MRDAGERKDARDVGSESPAKGSAKKQNIEGAKGGPREAKVKGTGRQPPQTSNRRPARHEQEPQQRRTHAPEEDPSLQGTGKPSPERIKQGSSQQGMAGGSGGGRARPDRTQERAESGEPAGEHTRHGRQKSPGDRSSRPD